MSSRWYEYDAVIVQLLEWIAKHGWMLAKLGWRDTGLVLDSALYIGLTPVLSLHFSQAAHTKFARSFRTHETLFKRWDYLVVSSQSVNSALNKNQSEFSISVLPELLQVLPHWDSLLDEVIQILWNLRCKTLLLQNAQHLWASHTADLQEWGTTHCLASALDLDQSDWIHTGAVIKTITNRHQRKHWCPMLKI